MSMYVRGGLKFCLITVAVAVHVAAVVSSGGELLFKPFNVSFDNRALIVDGERRLLISAGVHYPRATPQMWPDIISKSKESGADVIQTYVFWGPHEPVKGQYNFEGRLDLVKFVKLVGSSGLYLHLRIGPYVCAEWNLGGMPVWLRDVPGIEFRTDNVPFKEEMQLFVKKIVDLMRYENLLSWQGGPIIMLQIENEYGDVEKSYGQRGKNYIKWAAEMAKGLGAGVPWVMCKQVDAPEYIIDACNGYYCDAFKPNSIKKPKFWTENWDGWYTVWGGRLPHRPAEDLAFAVARFFQRGGSFMNYYMFFGGTNFGRSSGGPNYVTSYDYDAPLDEFGLLRQPKWGHLKDLHAAIKLCEAALVSVDSPRYIKLGPNQEAHVYGENVHHEGHNTSQSATESKCSAFLANIDEHNSASVQFFGQAYTLPPWSVSILPDCKHVVFNTAKVGAQTSIKTLESPLTDSNVPPKNSALKSLRTNAEIFPISEIWMSIREPIGTWGKDNFTVKGLLEHLNVTKDSSDYLWYKTSIKVSDDDVSFWDTNSIMPVLNIGSMRDLVRIFVNGKLAGSAHGHWVKVKQPLQLKQGYNELLLLSETIGLQNYGAFYEKDGAGFKGGINISGFRNGDIDLSDALWTYQVGLKGEFQKIYDIDENEMVEWKNISIDAVSSVFSWYKTYFDAPVGTEPLALNLMSMGKGQAWVNGHHIGRYWDLVAPKDGCQACDYRGPYNSNKCTTNCGKPTQIWYHVPRSWLQESNNLLVIFEETGGNPFDISIKSHSTESICAQVSENHYPPLKLWSHPDFVNGGLSVNDLVPEVHLQCDDGHQISSIEFASYGTPKGSCKRFSESKCHSSNSKSIISQACLGKNRCSVRVSNAIFGGDPCRHTVKTLAVEVRCAAPPRVGFSNT